MTEAYDPRESGLQSHKAAAPKQVNFAVLTMSDTRTLETDKSGKFVVNSMVAAGHNLLQHTVIPDDTPVISNTVRELAKLSEIDAILTTGGTGITSRDKTPEAIEPMLDGKIPGFGELFRMLSYEEIGPACILSRAFAGRVGNVLIFCLPGSTNAIKLAMNKILLPELPHLVHHLRS